MATIATMGTVAIDDTARDIIVRSYTKYIATMATIVTMGTVAIGDTARDIIVRSYTKYYPIKQLCSRIPGPKRKIRGVCDSLCIYRIVWGNHRS